MRNCNCNKYQEKTVNLNVSIDEGTADFIFELLEACKEKKGTK